MDSVMDAERLESKLAHCDGQDCRCGASACVECACYVDWTPAEVYTLRAELAAKSAQYDALVARVASAPVALMDTRTALGLCAPTNDDFPALYALQGKRVRLVLEDSDGN